MSNLSYWNVSWFEWERGRILRYDLLFQCHRVEARSYDSERNDSSVCPRAQFLFVRLRGYKYSLSLYWPTPLSRWSTWLSTHSRGLLYFVTHFLSYDRSELDWETMYNEWTVVWRLKYRLILFIPSLSIISPISLHTSSLYFQPAVQRRGKKGSKLLSRNLSLFMRESNQMVTYHRTECRLSLYSLIEWRMSSPL